MVCWVGLFFFVLSQPHTPLVGGGKGNFSAAYGLEGFFCL